MPISGLGKTSNQVTSSQTTNTEKQSTAATAATSTQSTTAWGDKDYDPEKEATTIAKKYGGDTFETEVKEAIEYGASKTKVAAVMTKLKEKVDSGELSQAEYKKFEEAATSQMGINSFLQAALTKLSELAKKKYT